MRRLVRILVILAIGAALAATALPSSREDCMRGGWMTYGIFKNHGDCVSFVATGGRNPGALG